MALLNGEVKVDAREFFAESMDVEGALNFANALQLFFRPIGAAVKYEWTSGSQAKAASGMMPDWTRVQCFLRLICILLRRKGRGGCEECDRTSIVSAKR